MGRRSPLSTYNSEFPLVPNHDNILIPEGKDVRSVLPNSHVDHTSQAGRRSSVWNHLPVQFSMYVKYMPSPSKNVELALYADDTAVITTSRRPALLVKYLGI
jgi:hypothetical protein